MAAMFVVAGGIRWRERRSALRAGPSGPSTAVVGSPQETYQELVDKSEFLAESMFIIDFYTYKVLQNHTHSFDWQSAVVGFLPSIAI